MFATTVTILLLVCAVNAQVHHNLEHIWKVYKQVHSKAYNSSEDAHRQAIFKSNLLKISDHNIEADLGLKSFRLGVNQFADLTTEEFSKLYKGYGKRQTQPKNVYKSKGLIGLPKSVDWRDKGLVTPIKDQKQCGSCWAFSAVASLEGQHAKATGKLVSLSEQNLVDCSGPEGNQGCNGGLMDQAFDYIIKNGGIDTEKSYPYEAMDDTCKFKTKNVGATVKSYVDVESGSEKALQEAAATIGPISVAIDASQPSFQFYSSGVYDEQGCSHDLDHGVTVVGYGTDEKSGKDYWLVKNSWGLIWGIEGYIKMSRNSGNQCGIADQASYPVV